jgi:hypothetical protein
MKPINGNCSFFGKTEIFFDQEGKDEGKDEMHLKVFKEISRKSMVGSKNHS